MTKATKYRDSAHARIYANWRNFSAWRTLSLVARCLLIEILLEYRPGNNGRLAWSCRRAARAVGKSKDTAARALTELEEKGWLRVERVGSFGQHNPNAPTCYSLAMYRNDETGDPPSNAFEIWEPYRLLPKPIRVAPEGHDGRISGTVPSHQTDTNPDPNAPIHLSDALKKTRAFKG